MRRRRILFVDNNHDFLDTRAEFLERAYDVVKAYSLAEAEQVLHNEWVHLAILDIRMLDDNDERDQSGLSLAMNELYRPVPKIMLTAYPTSIYTRAALRPASHGLPAAVDFLAKEEGAEALLQAVDTALANHLHINWNLRIHCQDHLSLASLPTMIDPTIEPSRLSAYHDELVDLFSKLFVEARQISVNRVLLQADQYVILEVVPYGDAGPEAQVLVSCGQRHRINDEAARYEKHAPKGARTGMTIKGRTTETIHFAATAYSLVELGAEEITTFKEFYRSRSSEEVATAVEHVFTVTLAVWHSNRLFKVEGAMLDQWAQEWLANSRHGLSRDELEQRASAICRETLRAGIDQLDYTPHTITLHLPDGSSEVYPNPIAHSYAVQLISEQSARGGVIHGRVTIDTVLVSSRARTWLVDFTHTDLGLLLRDFVEMETTAKLELLDTASLYMCYKLEKHVLESDEWIDLATAAALPQELRKVLDVVRHCRSYAVKTAHVDPEDYLVGLLIATLQRLATYDLDRPYPQRKLLPYAHALLLLAMLCKRLNAPSRSANEIPPQAREGIWIDDINKEVWIEGQVIEATRQEYKILLYLYQRSGKLCSRQEIVNEVLNDSVEAMLDESKLNSAISRLRRKIQLVSRKKHYLVTKRGYGYKLNV